MTAVPPKFDETASGLRVLALNVFGLPTPAISFVYPELRPDSPSERIRRLARERLGDFDLCVLTECWQAADRRVLAEIAREEHGLRYSHHFSAGVFGTGVMIVSRFPIVSTHFHRFRVNGRPQRVFHGDWYAGRGCAMAVVDASASGLGEVTVFASHLHAQYAAEDDYAAHRTAQARDMARFVALASPPRHRHGLVLVAGDFNMRPCALAHEVMRVYAGLGDTWHDALLSNAHDPGFTIHNDIERPVRIDYILFAVPAAAGLGADGTRDSGSCASRLELEWSRVTMNGWHGEDAMRAHPVVAQGAFYAPDPGLEARGLARLSDRGRETLEALASRDSSDSYMYSDHFGVAAFFSSRDTAHPSLQDRVAASLARLRTAREILPDVESMLARALCEASARRSANLWSSGRWAAVAVAGAALTAWGAPAGVTDAASRAGTAVAARLGTVGEAVLHRGRATAAEPLRFAGALGLCAVPLVLSWMTLWHGFVQVEDEIRALREMIQETAREGIRSPDEN
jgi:endonuclease/exonuclease/phosphatase family metal-dependent hydrolase